jgi:DNA-binding transcriptional regulator YiaG
MKVIITRPTRIHPEYKFHLADGTPIEERKALKAIRKQLGKNTTGFALLLGVSKRTVEGWEAGRLCRLRILERLANLTEDNK